MASREFLKILSSARLGDVFSQQKLAEAYLTGAFNTPIQPANALIWLEKSYKSLKNSKPLNRHLSNREFSGILESVVNIPLAQTFGSPAFQFGWESFWQLAEADTETNPTFAAKWQLVELLINPANKKIQTQLMDWLKTKMQISLSGKLLELDFNSFQKIARQYLQDIANGNSEFVNQAKELLIQLQPKNEALASLWDQWLEDQNEDA